MLFKMLLVVALVLGVLFVWRAWRPLPGMAALATGVVTLLAVVLFRNPGFLLLGGAVAYYMVQRAARGGDGK